MTDPHTRIGDREVRELAAYAQSGANATDTAWLSVRVGAEHEWLEPYGGSLAAVREYLERLA